MKRIMLCFIAAGIIAGPGGCKKETANQASEKPSLEQAWETPRELRVPESVMYDISANMLYVSNINGKPTDKNGKGFISRVSPEGKIVTLKWIEGMNAPKGMGIRDGRLYVTDIDRIHVIGIAAGKIEKTWDVAGAEFLNDIAIDGDGRVFITDMSTKKVHILEGDKIATWLTLDHERPNGLYVENNGLLIGTAAGILRADLKSKKLDMVVSLSGGIDGLKAAVTDAYLVSDWAGKTQLVRKGASPVVLLDTTAKKINAADFEYIADRKLLIIPTFFDNRLVAYRLKNL